MEDTRRKQNNIKNLYILTILSSEKLKAFYNAFFVKILRKKLKIANNS